MGHFSGLVHRCAKLPRGVLRIYGVVVQGACWGAARAPPPAEFTSADPERKALAEPVAPNFLNYQRTNFPGRGGIFGPRCELAGGRPGNLVPRRGAGSENTFELPAPCSLPPTFSRRKWPHTRSTRFILAVGGNLYSPYFRPPRTVVRSLCAATT